jgi:hypothetical protein
VHCLSGRWFSAHARVDGAVVMVTMPEIWMAGQLQISEEGWEEKEHLRLITSVREDIGDKGGGSRGEKRKQRRDMCVRGSLNIRKRGTGRNKTRGTIMAEKKWDTKLLGQMKTMVLA